MPGDPVAETLKTLREMRERTERWRLHLDRCALSPRQLRQRADLLDNAIKELEASDA